MPRYSAECTYRKTYDFDAKDDNEAREILNDIHGSIGVLDYVLEHEKVAGANLEADEVGSEIKWLRNDDTDEAVAVEVGKDT